MSQSFDFTGKSVVLTGGAAGIGFAILKSFLKSGAAVTVGDISDSKAATDALIAEGIGTDNLTFLKADVSNREDNEKLFLTALDKYGAVDIVCANCGVGGFDSFVNVTLADWRKVHAINTEGTFLMNNIAVKYWISSGSPGIIVNTSSIVGLKSFAGLAAYSSTKAAINSLTKNICKEFAAQGIRVNAVNPGFIRTAVYDTNKAAFDELIKQVPQARIGEPEEIADAVLFLASDGAKYINGHTLVVDGGTTV